MAVATSVPRAAFASDPARSRGRLHREPEAPARSPFRRDADRIIHSAAFRRLTHKTQVFVYHEGDHYRTRLTHTMEVAQIARSLARALGLDEDLAEALALAHDLGHTPFGHAGERALDRLLAGHGGFDHNAQSLRLVTRLERRYAAFDGLNLTWETLEGLVKHNGPLLDAAGAPRSPKGVPLAIAEYQALQDLRLATWPSAEAQVAAIADDIAYDTHDIDDGLRAGLFDLADLAGLPLVGDLIGGIDREWPRLERARRVHELSRRLITALVADVVAETSRHVADLGPDATDEAVRAADRALVGLSPAVAKSERAIKDFLFPRMYRHKRVMRIMGEAERVVEDLFRHYLSSPEDMPEEWRRGLEDAAESRRARRVADYIAGMTDRFLLAEHARVFDSTPDLR